MVLDEGVPGEQDGEGAEEEDVVEVSALSSEKPVRPDDRQKGAPHDDHVREEDREDLRGDPPQDHQAEPEGHRGKPSGPQPHPGEPSAILPPKHQQQEGTDEDDGGTGEDHGPHVEHDHEMGALPSDMRGRTSAG